MASQIAHYKICLTIVLFLCGCATAHHSELAQWDGSEWHKSQVVETWGSPTRSLRCRDLDVWQYEFYRNQGVRPQSVFLTFKDSHLIDVKSDFSCQRVTDLTLDEYLSMGVHRGHYTPVSEDRYVEADQR